MKHVLYALGAEDEARRAQSVAPADARPRDESSFTVLHGDMRELLAAMPPESVHAIVCDPPYGLEFMGKQWDQQVPGPEYWRACLRVAKPGAHLVAFGGTRTAHRLACAIEDAGWELRDCVMWLYGSGFPKSHDVSKAIDRDAGVEPIVVGPHPTNQCPGGEWCKCSTDGRSYGETKHAPATAPATVWKGWGTALKPAYEPVYLCRKPFKGSVAANVLEHGCGGINVDGCRIGVSKRVPGSPKRADASVHTVSLPGYAGGSGHDPDVGRWPANLCLDEVAAALLDAEVGQLTTSAWNGKMSGAKIDRVAYSQYGAPPVCAREKDTGGPSRFFYVAKASRSEREQGLENFEPATVTDGRAKPIDNPYLRGETQRKCTHPTVKPLALMRWLVRLITPPGGTVLDPFTGSGTTGVAAVLEGARFIGCELSAEYAELARARIAHAADEDDGDQLTLFERAELKPPRKAQLSMFDTEESA